MEIDTPGGTQENILYGTLKIYLVWYRKISHYHFYQINNTEVLIIINNIYLNLYQRLHMQCIFLKLNM